jgi:HPt (histidine-containing phosphotransfer) domain-containing protein
MPEILDIKRLDGLRRENADDPGLVDELLEIFLRETPPLIDALEAGAARGDLVSAGRSAHRLSGSARTLGALAFGEACAAIEDAAKAGDAAKVGVGSAGIRAEFARVAAAIAAYRK